MSKNKRIILKAKFNKQFGKITYLMIISTNANIILKPKFDVTSNYNFSLISSTTSLLA